MRKTSLSFILFAASPLLWAQTDVKIVSQLNHQAVAIPFNRMAIPELPTQIKTALAIILPEGETVISANCGDARIERAERLDTRLECSLECSSGQGSTSRSDKQRHDCFQSRNNLLVHSERSLADSERESGAQGLHRG
jgi:hypothetical protein